MTDTPATSVTSPSTPSTKTAAATKKSAVTRAKPSHPPTSEMVNNAIKNLKERGGSSLQAIKKYIAANYKVDTEKSAPFIKKYLKSAVTGGTLVQTKGKGASGSFKLAAAGKSTEGAAAVKKSPSKGTKRVPKEKKTVTPSKAVSKKKSPAKKAISTTEAPKAKKVATKKAVASKTKTPTKAKKAAKSPTKKPKAPKPKKAAPKAVKPTKKVAQKKK